LAESQESSGDYKKRIENLEAKLSTTYSQIEQAEQLVKQFKEMYEQSQIRISQIGSVQTHTDNLDEKLKEAQQEILYLVSKLKDLQEKLRGYEDKVTLLIIIRYSYIFKGD
jgi:chromosome segregation ATPase